MSSVQTIQAGYAAFANNDPSVLFGAQAVGEGVFGRLLAAIDNFSAAPDRFVDGGDDVIVLGRSGGTMKHSGAKLDATFCHVYRFQCRPDRVVPAVHGLGAVGSADAVVAPPAAQSGEYSMGVRCRSA